MGLSTSGLKDAISSALTALQTTKETKVPKYKTENGANVPDGETTLTNKSPLPDDVIAMIADGVSKAVVEYITANAQLDILPGAGATITLLPQAPLVGVGGGVPGPVTIPPVPIQATIVLLSSPAAGSTTTVTTNGWIK